MNEQVDFNDLALPNAKGPLTGTYHNPRTGQEFKGLPIDTHNLTRYLARGWVLGKAPPELREKWKNSEKTVVSSTVDSSFKPQGEDAILDIVAKLAQEVQDLRKQLATGESGTIEVVEKQENKQESPELWNF